MKNLENCCGLLDASESSLSLTNVSLEKSDKEIPAKLTLGLAKEKSNIKMSENGLDISITVRVIGFKTINDESTEEEYNLSDDEVSFKIELTYSVL